jgi:hypothetical protein
MSNFEMTSCWRCNKVCFISISLFYVFCSIVHIGHVREPICPSPAPVQSINGLSLKLLGASCTWRLRHLCTSPYRVPSTVLTTPVMWINSADQSCAWDHYRRSAATDTTSPPFVKYAISNPQLIIALHCTLRLDGSCPVACHFVPTCNRPQIWQTSFLPVFPLGLLWEDLPRIRASVAK